MKGTYLATSIPDLEQIYTNTSTKYSITQVFLDCSLLQTGDELEITIITDTTGSSKVLLSEILTIDNLGDNQELVVNYPIILEPDDTYTVTLNQIAGTARNIPWSVNAIEK